MQTETPPRQPAIADHMPSPHRDLEAYRQFYASLGAEVMDKSEEAEQCHEIAIPPGLAAAEVYRLIPTAPDFEYGGYLTPTHVRYMRCREEEAECFGDQECKFHTHPTSHPDADVPSPPDVYHFLKWPARRAVTVGAAIIWVWTKAEETVEAARRLAAWESEHMIPTMTEMVGRHGERATYEYAVAALVGLGLPVTDLDDWRARWKELLEGVLGFTVTVMEREARQ